MGLSQLDRTPRWIIRAAVLFAVAMIALAGLQSYVPTAQVFRDMPHAVLEAGPYEPLPLLGFMSNLGVLLWCCAASAAGLGACIVRDRRSDRAFAFLACLAGFSAILMADDFFLLHEEVLPRLFGLDEKVLLAAYGLAFAAGIVAFRDILRRTAWRLLAVSVAFLAGAAVFDLAKDLVFDATLQRWLEDGTKFVGIVFWAVFALRVAWVLCTEADAQEAARHAD